ncbi:MAG: peptidoglycan DD-metalloendopeptidase family protein [Oscillibacter sp.]|nr:peptidoglycan DD-metalloendopeptidase family protein [Oscillibacter sp.]
MEQPNKNKRQAGQSVAFYTALVVCLIAAGVGTWQLLRPQEAGEDVSAASSAVALPAPEPVPEAVAGEDVPDAVTEEASPVLKPADAEPSASNEKPKSDAKPSTSDEKAKSDTKPSTSDAKAKSDTKPSTSDGKAKSDAKASTSDKKSSTSSGKTTSDKKQSASDKKSPGDTVRPLSGETVTGFSMDKLLYNETMRDWRTHDGIDIAADAGAAVAAAKAGTVESVTADPIMGTTVVIRHADKWETVYSSLTDMPEVEAGDEVAAGQVIGYAGETAASESALGTHLHFTVLNDGTPVDPETFFS